jgi:hypothetical protein
MGRRGLRARRVPGGGFVATGRWRDGVPPRIPGRAGEGEGATFVEVEVPQSRLGIGDGLPAVAPERDPVRPALVGLLFDVEEEGGDLADAEFVFEVEPEVRSVICEVYRESDRAVQPKLEPVAAPPSDVADLGFRVEQPVREAALAEKDVEVPHRLRVDLHLHQFGNAADIGVQKEVHILEGLAAEHDGRVDLLAIVPRFAPGIALELSGIRALWRMKAIVI